MKKVTSTKLSLGQVLILDQELQQLNVEKDIPFIVKYELSKLAGKTTEIVKRFNTAKLELFKKYGTCTDEKSGTYTLEGSKDFEKGVKELNALVEVIETFDETFSLSSFLEVKSNVPYTQIFKFFNA